MSHLINIDYFPLREETDLIIKAGIEVHKQLGSGFLEIVYKDALEYEFRDNSVFYTRENEYSVFYKKRQLPHKFYADFVIWDKVILEIKAKTEIADEDYAQIINYLKCSGCKVGLILNFGREKLGIKRVLL